MEYTESLPDMQWCCEKCRRHVYWYGWEKSRVIVTNCNGATRSVCFDCWPEADKEYIALPGRPTIKRYTFLGITTVKC